MALSESPWFPDALAHDIVMDVTRMASVYLWWRKKGYACCKLPLFPKRCDLHSQLQPRQTAVDILSLSI